jgi:hypothetical protein
MLMHASQAASRRRKILHTVIALAIAALFACATEKSAINALQRG